MPQATIASATTTTITGIPRGDHLLEIYGTWGGTSANIRHAVSSISLSGLSALTATPSNGSIITTAGDDIEVVTTGGSGISLTVRINHIENNRAI